MEHLSSADRSGNGVRFWDLIIWGMNLMNEVKENLILLDTWESYFFHLLKSKVTLQTLQGQDRRRKRTGLWTRQIWIWIWNGECFSPGHKITRLHFASGYEKSLLEWSKERQSTRDWTDSNWWQWLGLMWCLGDGEGERFMSYLKNKNQQELMMDCIQGRGKSWSSGWPRILPDLTE